MRSGLFGPSEVVLPVLGQGTWNMECDDEAEAIAALRAGIDAGLNHIDTAEMYGDGQVESIVGRAIEGRRDTVFLVSKVLPRNASRQGTITACERSLTRLGTDYLDCYLLHWPGNHPLEETFAGFEQLARDGKIRRFGVSNFDVADLELAVQIAGREKIACNQVLYHLEERGIEHEVVGFCQRHQVAVVGYSPLGSGRFPRPGSPGRTVLDAIARQRGVTAEQLALAFLTRTAGVFAIPKASRVEHVRQNAEAASLELTESEIRRIDVAFDVGAPRPLATL